MRHGNPHLHADIKEARRKKRAASSELRRTVRKVQAECDHPYVIHQDWRPSDYFASSPGHRICPKCGLEEFVKYGTVDYWGGSITNACGTHEGYGRPVFADKPIIKADTLRYRTC